MPIKYRVKITKHAEHDIESIWAYIASDNASSADKFIRQLENHARALEIFPLRCVLIPENEILNTHYRHLLIGQYRIIFSVYTGDVHIMRIVHGARLLDASMFELQS